MTGAYLFRGRPHACELPAGETGDVWMCDDCGRVRCYEPGFRRWGYATPEVVATMAMGLLIRHLNRRGEEMMDATGVPPG